LQPYQEIAIGIAVDEKLPLLLPVEEERNIEGFRAPRRWRREKEEPG
jgi:hypothetical protein